MDPNGSLTSQSTLYKSDDLAISYITPLHEALRGTTAMPTLEEFQERYSSMPLLLQAPQGSATPLVTLHPPPLMSGSILAPVQPYDATLFEANFTAPAIPSFLQGDHHDIIHDGLSVNGVDLGPIGENHAWLVPEEQRPSTLPGSSYKEPYGDVPYVSPTIAFPSHLSTPTGMAAQQAATGRTGGNFHNFHAPSTSSTTTTGTGRRKYTCRDCNITFPSPQAFGGHMSFHSKERKKMMLDYPLN